MNVQVCTCTAAHLDEHTHTHLAMILPILPDPEPVQDFLGEEDRKTCQVVKNHHLRILRVVNKSA